jgi:hypothetical protein
MVWWTAAALAQDPLWQACRPKAGPLVASALFDRPLPPLPRALGDATPAQAVAGHRLVVDAAGWWLDGAVVTELPKLDAVVAAIAADLPAAEVARLLAALRASGAQVWTVADAADRLPAGSRAPSDLPPVPKGGLAPAPDAPPGTIAAWNKLLGACGPGKELVRVGGDCATWAAAWKAVTEQPRCLLPPRLVRDVQGPVGAGDPAGVAVTPLVVDPDAPSWLRPEQTWADVEPGAGWVIVGPAPWGDGPPRDPDGLLVRDRVTPEWPAGADRSKKAPEVLCVAEVTIERDGRPSAAVIAGCGEPYAEAVRAAVLRWEWHPPVVEGLARRVVTRVAFRFLGGVAGTRED